MNTSRQLIVNSSLLYIGLVDKYISKYSNGKEVTAAQYITELICENKARADKKDLHYRFWNSKEWSKFYKAQIFSANALLKKYSAKAIIAAIKDKRSSRTYSLRSKFIKPIIEQHEKIIASQNTQITIDLNRDKETFKKTTKGKGIISKLKDLDDEQN